MYDFYNHRIERLREMIADWEAEQPVEAAKDIEAANLDLERCIEAETQTMMIEFDYIADSRIARTSPAHFDRFLELYEALTERGHSEYVRCHGAAAFVDGTNTLERELAQRIAFREVARKYQELINQPK